MKFETVRIHFLSDFLVCCHPEILLPLQRDVRTSPLLFDLHDSNILLKNDLETNKQTKQNFNSLVTSYNSHELVDRLTFLEDTW